MTRTDIDTIKRQLQSIKNDLLIQQTQKNMLEKQIGDIDTKLADIDKQSSDTNSAFIFLKQRAADTRTEAIETIENAVSDGLSYMFQEEYIFKFKSTEGSTSETAAFNLTPKIYKKINGKIVERCPYVSNGGGLIEIISILLRFSFIVYRKYNGIVLLDEALASVSADKMMDRLVAFLKSYVEKLGLQCLFISHRADRFAMIANKNFLITRDDGLAVVNEMTSAKLLEYYQSIQDGLEYDEIKN